jgi:GNAT superfamily N-acetyltransferase
MQLKAAAGWNQTAADWTRLLTLSRGGCFGVRDGGVLAASGTSISYGEDLAWIGMMLTLPEYRRRGFARQLMERALEFLTNRGVRCIGLDATDMGQPLYESLGFRVECQIERWVRPAGAASFEAREPNYEANPILDREVFGADRGALLAALAAEGHALWRPGSIAAYFGPCVTESVETAESQLGACLAHYGAAPVYWDLFPQNAAVADLARAYGFERARVLQRMFYRGEAPAWDPARTIAIAGLEYG